MDPRKNGAATFQALFLDHSKEEQETIAGLTDPAYTCCADRTYEGRTAFLWNGLLVEIQEAPGHSPGSQLIWVQKDALFTGDSLIPGREVITRLPGGSKAAYLEKTLPILQSQEAGCCIFPGHGEEGKLCGGISRQVF